LLVSPRLIVIGSPPANIPAPIISFEKVTWSWTGKYPPEGGETRNENQILVDQV